MKDLIYTLTEKTDSELEISKNISILSEMINENITEGSLKNGIFDYKDFLQNQSNLIKSSNQKMHLTIIESMKEFIKDQINDSKLKFSIISSLNSEFKQYLADLQQNKINYHSISKQLEEAKTMFEISNLNKNIKQDLKNKQQNRIMSLIQEVKESEKNYIKVLNETNLFRESYIEKVEEILSFYQRLDLEFNSFVKLNLIKIYSETINYCQETIDLSKKKLELVQKIIPENDISEFIDKYQTNYLPPQKIEFISYNTNIDKDIIFKNIDLSNKNYIVTNLSKDSNATSTTTINNHPIMELVNNVKSFCNPYFCKEIPDSLNIQESKAFSEIRIYLNNLWESKILDDDDFRIFLKHIKEKRNRNYFLSCLNKYRINGMFLLSEKSYSLIAEALGYILDISYSECDYESIKFSIILSQTFYKVTQNIPSFLNLSNNDDKLLSTYDIIHRSSFNKNDLNEGKYNNSSINKQGSKTRQLGEESISNVPKIYLQASIQNHEAFKNIETWNGVLKFSIKEELNNKSHNNINNYNNSISFINKSPEDEIINKEIIKNLAFGQLLSVGYNMLSFGLNKEIIISFLKKFRSFYKLDNETESSIILHIEEFSNESEEFIKDEIIRNSLVNVVVLNNEYTNGKKSFIENCEKVEDEKEIKSNDNLHNKEGKDNELDLINDNITNLQNTNLNTNTNTIVNTDSYFNNNEDSEINKLPDNLIFDKLNINNDDKINDDH